MAFAAGGFGGGEGGGVGDRRGEGGGRGERGEGGRFREEEGGLERGARKAQLPICKQNDQQDLALLHTWR